MGTSHTQPPKPGSSWASDFEHSKLIFCIISIDLDNEKKYLWFSDCQLKKLNLKISVAGQEVHRPSVFSLMERDSGGKDSASGL